MDIVKGWRTAADVGVQCKLEDEEDEHWMIDSEGRKREEG